MNYAFVLMYILVALAAYVLLRNAFVHSVRIAFINDDLLWPFEYNKLPSYDGMLLGPSHQLRWTKDQWVKWVAYQK